MKKFISVILSCFFTINLFCYSGLFAGAENIKIIKTKWFDIIYPETSEKTASVLYDNADKIYEEVTEQYGLEPTFRLPVVITDQVDTYNAFSTPVPYNRIVLYNTTTNTLDDASALDQLFLTTFRHELTHAVTFNIKNGFWTGVTKIFGDPVLPGCFFITPGMAEGAAVASESVNGDGRLNDGFATHFVKQAKIEGKFPSYYDVQGTNTSTTLPLHYYFNGPFHQFLQNKYGLEKYAEWWHRVININRPGVNWSFKKTFGNSIRKEWNLFEESYKVPDVITNPIENNIVNDFFEKENPKSSIKNSSGARYSDLQSCDNGLFYSRDTLRIKNSKEIFFVSQEDLLNGNINPKSVFVQQLMEDFSVSKDGRFIAVSYYATAKPNITSKIKIYDKNNNNFFIIDEDSLKNGSIVKFNDDYYLVCHNYQDSDANFIIKKLIFEDDKIVSAENIVKKTMEYNSFVSNFTDLGNGTFSFIKKNGADFSILVSNLAGDIVGEFCVPEGIRIRQLSENNGDLYFSWVNKDSMARVGKLNISNGIFTLNNTDISGGIFNPVLINCDDGQRLAYIGCFFNEDKILTIASSNQILTNKEEYKARKIENHNKSEKIAITDISSLSQPYKRFENIHKGIIAPVSLYSSELIGENYGSSSPSQLLPFGVSYITANPWNGGSTSDDLLILTSGWSYLTNSLGFEVLLNQGTGSSLFSYSLDLKSEFDRRGWKQSSVGLNLGSGFHFGKSSIFKISNDFRITGGKENNLNNKCSYLDHFSFWDKSCFEMCAPIKNDVALNIYDIFSVEYSYNRPVGPGNFEQLRFATGINTAYVYDSKLGEGLVINPAIIVSLPKLIPVTQKRGFTYNLPVRIGLSLFPIASDYGLTGATLKTAKSSLLDSKINVVLFGLDIQKSIPFVEMFYINDFKVSAGYASTIATYKGYHSDLFQFPYVIEYFANIGNGKSVYLDSVYLKLDMNITPNIGLLANATGISTINIFGQVIFPINVLENMKSQPQFSFGINTNF